MLGEALPDRDARAGDDVRDARREPGLHQQLDQVHGGERGDLARLDDEGVARGERRGDLPAGLEQRVVPGGDQRADADRLVHDDAVHVGAARVHDTPAALVHDEVGEVAEGVGDVVDVDPALFQGLAGVPALDQRDLLAVALEQVPDAAQQRGALGDRRAGPRAGVEGPPGRGDGRVRVVRPALGHGREGPGVCGVEDLPLRAGCGVTPHPVHMNGLDCCRHVVLPSDH